MTSSRNATTAASWLLAAAPPRTASDSMPLALRDRDPLGRPSFVGTAEAEHSGYTQFEGCGQALDLAPQGWVLSGQEHPWPINLLSGYVTPG
jgi:hypothetical protein